MKSKYIVMSKWISLVLLFTAFAACKNSTEVQIDGKISDLNSSTVYLMYEGESGQQIDSVVADKNGFKVNVPKDKYNRVTVLFNNKKDWVTGFLNQSDKVSFNGNAQEPELITVKGGSANDLLSTFHKNNQALFEEKQHLMTSIQTMQSDSTMSSSENIMRLSNVIQNIRIKAAEFVQAHPDSEASLLLISNYLIDSENIAKTEMILAKIAPQLHGTELYQELDSYCKKVRSTMPGEKAPEFSVKDIYGKDIKSSDYKGKFLLLTFAAPWCELCNEEYPYLEDIRKQISVDSLAMLTITLDDHPSQIIDSLKKSKAKWDIVADSLGEASALIDLYNVNSIPLNYLIDKDGNIQLKSETGFNLLPELDSIMKIK